MFAQPNNPPITKTFTQNGTWQFICTLHSTYNAQTDSWTGMVGTANVTGSAPAGAGDRPASTTPSTASTAAPGRRATRVTVSAVGPTPVDYRSADKAGNVETAKSVAFSIKAKAPRSRPRRRPRRRRPRRPTATPTATPHPRHADGPAGAAVSPAPVKPSVKLAKPSKTTVAKFAKSGLEDPGHVHGGDERHGDGDGHEQGPQGPQAQVGHAGQATVKCKAGITTLTLKPTKATARALAKVKKSRQGHAHRHRASRPASRRSRRR